MVFVTRKTKKEIRRLRESGKILVKALNAVAEKAREAVSKKVTTKDLDRVAEEVIRSCGAKPAFLNYTDGYAEPFPASLCTSVNNEVVHGIPSDKRVIKEGDLVKIDVGVSYKKMITDATVTVPIGEVSQQALRLTKATKIALDMGIKKLRPGATLGDFGSAVERYAKKKGFKVVRDLVGHGVGYAVHEPPQIPNFGKPGVGMRLEEGMVLALEPMLNVGTEKVFMADDGFTFLTADGSLSAQFEHTVVITENGCEILTK